MASEARCSELLGPQTAATAGPLAPVSGEPPAPGGAVPLAQPWAPSAAPPPGPASKTALPTSAGATESWPMEYVLRPQTLPAGVRELAITSDVFRPEAGTSTLPTGYSYTFHSSLSLGVWMRHGLTNRMEMTLAGGARPGDFRGRELDLRGPSGARAGRGNHERPFAPALGNRGPRQLLSPVVQILALRAARSLRQAVACQGRTQTDPVTGSNALTSRHIQPAGQIEGSARQWVCVQ
jgi:hypothetical protein